MREHNNLPATFNYRISAFSVDYGSVVLIMLIMIFMQFGTAYDNYIRMAITLVGWYIINVGPNFFSKGSSIGKKHNDIKIVTKDFKEVSLATMHLREFLILFFSFITVGLYVFIALYFLEKRIDKRAIHDLICNTRVIRTKPFVGKSD